jgi:ADP-ribose pyrophosphatase YjhB (NUDIX family)
MSRKSGVDQSKWKMPSTFSFVGEYGPFNIKGVDPIDYTLVWLCNSSRTNATIDDDGRHDMYAMAGAAQEALLEQPNSNLTTILVIDVKDMFEDEDEYNEALSKEIEEVGLTRKFGKKLMKFFQKLILKQVILAGEGEICALILKLSQTLQRIEPNMISELWLMHPELSTKYVNTHLVNNTASDLGVPPKMSAKLNVVSKSSTSSRVSMLEHFFPIGIELLMPDVNNWFSTVFQSQDSKSPAPSPPTEYRPDFCNDLGKQLFMSVVKVEMNRHTKQHERNCTDITSDLLIVETPPEITPSDVDWSECERHVGALVLRGNRCVLTRSLYQEWEGMCIPSVVPEPDETPHDAAVRAVFEFADVEDSEVRVLTQVLPVAIYAPDGRPILVELYALYATNPPPDGPLEDADMEDDESPYDWYTYPNAIQKLDKASIAALQIMALNLAQAANVGLVPAKWGGIFGQEFMLNDTRMNPTENRCENPLLETNMETRKENIFQGVEKSNSALEL